MFSLKLIRNYSNFFWEIEIIIFRSLSCLIQLHYHKMDLKVMSGEMEHLFFLKRTKWNISNVS